MLRKAGLRTREINDIANLSFVAGKTNRAISDKEPKFYLPPLIEKIGITPFEAQAIPTGPDLLDTDAYDRFLTERRRMVAERLNQFLGTA